MTEATTAVAAAPALGAILSQRMSIKDTVIAQFKETEASLQAMADKYRNVVYDVTTSKGMKDAVAARAELRDDGRRMLTKTAAKVKADVNELKQVMGDEVERLVAIVKPVEDAIDAQIQVEVQRKADEKAERERLEAERVAGHRANIEKLRGYMERAEGQPLEALHAAIETLNGLAFGEEWQEFAQEAQATRDNTVAGLRSLVQREEQRIENENLRAQLAALQPSPPAAPPAEPQPSQLDLVGCDAPPEPGASASTTAAPFQVEGWDDEPMAEAAPPDPAHMISPPVRWGGRGHGFGAIDAAPPAAAQQEDDGSRVTLGQIKDLIAPLSIDAFGLERLGFKHIDTDRNARLYRECDLPAIVTAMREHLATVLETATA